MNEGTARTSFVIGALLTLPGASYLAGLDQIHKLHYSTAGTVAAVVIFNLVMMALLEVPMLAFVIAPDWTPDAITRTKAWASRHSRRFAIHGFGGVGVTLLIKGIVGLAT